MPALRFSNSVQYAKKTGKRADQDPRRLCSVNYCIFFRRLQRCIWRRLLSDAETLAAQNGYELVKFFFLLTFAAAIPAIISGGIAERAMFYPQLFATAVLAGLIYPFFEGIAWNQRFGFQAWLKTAFSHESYDFGSVAVHAVGGWAALPEIIFLGARRGRYGKDGTLAAHPPSSIPFLALGAWIQTVGWFGFNVMSAQTLEKMNGLVAINSVMAMVGGTLFALWLGRNAPGFVYNGPLAGLVAVCAGSDIMPPVGALGTGGIAAAIFVEMFRLTQNKWRIDDVIGAWALHGLCGVWGESPPEFLACIGLAGGAESSSCLN